MSTIKHPWKVAYDQREITGWSKYALPRIVDAEGGVIFTPHQYAAHPGLRDVRAEMLCNLVVIAVNGHIEKRLK